MNWESLTKNLVTFNFIMGVHWKIWFFLVGEGVHELKVGGGRGWTVFRFKGEVSLVKKDRVFSLPHFGRQGACHDITKSADSQTNINFFSKWLYNCRNSTKKPNDFRLRILGNKKVFEKTQIGWRQMLVASQDFFTYFQIFCPGW